MNDFNLKLKEIKVIFDTFVKNNQFISSEKIRLNNETKIEKSKVTAFTLKDIAKLRIDYARNSILDTVINDTNI